MKTMPRNPRPPKPELIIREFGRGMIYAWTIDHHGIQVYTESKEECKAEWLRAYHDEYFYDQVDYASEQSDKEYHDWDDLAAGDSYPDLESHHSLYDGGY